MTKSATITKTITLKQDDLRYLQFMVSERTLSIQRLIEHANRNINEPLMFDALKERQRELYTLRHIKREIGRYNEKTGPAPTRIVFA